MNKNNIIVLIIIIIIVGMFLYMKYKSYIKNNIYYLKLLYNNPNHPSKISTTIPLYIYQTFYTKNLSKDMQESVDLIKNTNPEFTYILADDDECYNFILNNFPPSVADAYLRIIPGAYKADLWRYCILYTYGGIYLDIKYKPVNNFKFINLVDREHFVLDAPYSWNINNYGIYNAFMVCTSHNKILLDCINQIVLNVKNNFYGGSCLEPTGPLLLGSVYKSYKDITTIDMYLNISIKTNPKILQFQLEESIIYDNIKILISYNTYRSEQKKNPKKPHYSKLWKKKLVYKLN